MNFRIQFFAICAGLLALLFVLHLIRRRTLREDYGLWWVLAAIGLLTISIWHDLLDLISQTMGIAYPPTVLLLALTMIVFLLSLHYATSLSRLADQNKRLAQEVALLRCKIEREVAKQPLSQPTHTD